MGAGEWLIKPFLYAYFETGKIKIVLANVEVSKIPDLKMLTQKSLIPEQYGHYSFTNYIPGGNAILLQAIRQLRAGAASFHESRWFFGPKASGKTHLLNAFANDWQQSGDNVACMRLRQADFSALVDFVIAHSDAYQAVVIDDAQLIAGELQLERSLYRLINYAQGKNTPILMAAGKAHEQIKWRTSDVRTRLRLLPAQQLRVLTGSATTQPTHRLAQESGLHLNASAWSYIDKHYPRDMGQLAQLIASLTHWQQATSTKPGLEQIKKTIKQIQT